MASDEDLKLSDLLRYYERDSQAALVRWNEERGKKQGNKLERMGGVKIVEGVCGRSQ